ncbi:MAG: twin-arginine translocase subunit TatB [Chloroflexi bacterium]|nr:twin-arginine translocase subunit TatB [Chloroflexota bacterium]
MDLFGIGPMELLVVLVLALIVLGPRQLPDAARKLAKLTRDLRRMWTEVSTDFAREMNVEEALGDIRSVTDTVKTIRRPPSPARLLLDKTTTSDTPVTPQPTAAQEGSNASDT